MKKIVTLVLSFLLITAMFANSAALEPVTIVTSFYPIFIITQNILKNVADVSLENLTQPTTGCLHDYQLLASDMVTLSGADAIIINGGGMEAFIPVISAQFPELKIIDSSQDIELLYSEDHESSEQGQDHQEAEHDHGHEHGDYNAHFWLDPHNAAIMSLNISSALKMILPAQAEMLEQNTLSYIKMLNDLDAELKERLAGLERRDIVTFHEAFSYFAKAYDFHVVAVLTLEPDEGMTPQMLKKIVEKVRDAQLPPLFTEPQYDDRAAKAVAQETGAVVYELDPIVTGDGSMDAYQTVMRKNAQVLIEALGIK